MLTTIAILFFAALAVDNLNQRRLRRKAQADAKQAYQDRRDLISEMFAETTHCPHWLDTYYSRIYRN